MTLLQTLYPALPDIFASNAPKSVNSWISFLALANLSLEMESVLILIHRSWEWKSFIINLDGKLMYAFHPFWAQAIDTVCFITGPTQGVSSWGLLGKHWFAQEVNLFDQEKQEEPKSKLGTGRRGIGPCNRASACPWNQTETRSIVCLPAGRASNWGCPSLDTRAAFCPLTQGWWNTSFPESQSHFPQSAGSPNF